MTGAERDRLRGGNGCLYAILGFGAVMVVIGIGIEALPEFPTSRSMEPLPSPPVPAPEPVEVPYYEPPSVPEPRAHPEPVAPTVEERRGTQIFWHAEWPGDPSTPCVLAVGTTRDHRMNRLTLACANGLLLEGSVPPTTPRGGRLGTGTSAVYRATFTSQATGGDGLRFDIEVNTSEHQLDVTQIDTGRRSMLYIEDLSVPVPGHGSALPQTQASHRTVRLAVPARYTGRIPRSIAHARGTGRHPRAYDPVCVLSASPVLSDEFSCRVTLRCSGEVVYGAGRTGYNDCVLRGGAVVSASDTGTTLENEDPRLELDLDSDTVTVSDAGQGWAWSATFDLVTDPRCQVARFQGSVITGDAAVLWQDWQLENGTPPSMTWADGEVSALDDLTVSCPDGSAFGRRLDGSVDLTFGYGFRSLAGYASPDGEQPRGIYAFRR